MIDRRVFIASAAALALPVRAWAEENPFGALEPQDSRLGVHAIHLGTGRSIGHRADERFAMCSTFKWALTGLVLREFDAGRLSLLDDIRVEQSDLVYYSPRTEPLAGTSMTIEALCDAAVTIGDNTAANLLVARIGGPEGFTARLRELGDGVTRLDRLEPMLNENRPGDPRDTTTPAAMTGMMRQVLFGDVLTPSSRARLRQWMIDATTGLNRLRRGLPDGWIAGDKTGTSENGAVNDVGFAIPPGSTDAGAIVIACYLDTPHMERIDTNAIHAEVARRVVAELGG